MPHRHSIDGRFTRPTAMYLRHILRMSFRDHVTNADRCQDAVQFQNASTCVDCLFGHLVMSALTNDHARLQAIHETYVAQLLRLHCVSKTPTFLAVTGTNIL